METVWWGRSYEGAEHPKYFARMKWIHRVIFGKDPKSKRDGQADDPELEAKIKKEMEHRRETLMQQGGKKGM